MLAPCSSTRSEFAPANPARIYDSVHSVRSASKRYAKSVISRITGAGIGDRTRVFLHGAAWTMIGAVLARGLAGGATLLAARCMGPEKFGEASLALAASLWIQVPMLIGIPTAMIHYLPSLTPEKRSEWASMGLSMMTVASLLSLLIANLMSDPLRGWLGVPPHVYKWTLYWCTGYVLYTAGMSWASGEERFSSRAALESLFAGLFLALVAVSRLYKQTTASNYMKSYMVAYGVIGAWIFFQQRRRFGWSHSAAERKHILFRFLSYGMIVFIGGLASALLLAPGRLVANRFLSSTEVGLLSIYQGGGIQIGSIFSGIGAQVFFPIASRTPDKHALLVKMKQAASMTLLPGCLGITILMALYFKLLGKHYPFDLGIAMMYAFSSYLYVVFGIFSWYFASMGRRGLLAQTLIGLTAGGVNFAACLLFIPRYHIGGAGMAYALGALVGIGALLLLRIPGKSKYEDPAPESALK